MITSFLLGIIAGYAAAPAEERLKPLVEQFLPGASPSLVEKRAISLSVSLCLAAIVGWLVGASGAIALTLGGVIGVLGPRIHARIKAARAPDYDS